MFQVIALICTLGQDPRECLPPTARAVEIIEEAPTELVCLRTGVMHLPQGVKLGENEYPKIMCVRRHS